MLTQRLQIQLIADRLAGLNVKPYKVRDFNEPWRTCFQAIIEAPRGTEQQSLLKALAGRVDRDSIVGAILAAVPGAGPEKFPSLQEIAAELPPVDWLWPGWIPLGMLSLLGAVPGAGKSYVALDLARRIIAGEKFPDGAPVPVPGANVIYVDGEAIPQVTNERALVWEMDRSCLYLMLPEANDMMLDFHLTSCQDRLVEMLHALHPALVIVDSLSSINSRGENAVEDVRSVLAFFNAAAACFRCAVLLIHHLRKRSATTMMDALSADDLRGSTHLVAMARTVLGLSVIPDAPGGDRNSPRKMEVIKTNLARYPEPLGVVFVPLQPSGVRLQYGDPPCRYEPPTEIEKCSEWLLQTLREHGEPMKPRDLVEAASAEGFSRATLFRARKRLGTQIVDIPGHQSPDNAWTIQHPEREE